MGYNTVMMVLNDALHLIKEDKEFGRKIYDATYEAASGFKRVDISSHGYCNVATVISCQHADIAQVVVVGGNYGTNIGNFWTRTYHTPEGELELIRELAEKHGYALRKKSVKR